MIAWWWTVALMVLSATLGWQVRGLITEWREDPDD